MTATHESSVAADAGVELARVSVVESTISGLREALQSRRITSVELVVECLNRIAAFDRRGPRLNAVPVLNEAALAEALASDLRRAAGNVLGPLDGIPYTAKDSFKVRGMTVAAGSPAFANLTATDDAFTIGRLRAGGAVLIGLTNMPPMANGGMQRGLYGRAESPYNADFLTSAFGSGSSNGSGTATAASFAAFGLGEETWSSGRAPASNNALVAYTPSRGVISVRGNWPLVPTMDVVVPHTRSVADLLEVLDVIVADDVDSRGDFWRVQSAVEIPEVSSVRPESYANLRHTGVLAGRRFGVPRMYINADVESPNPILTRESIVDLWRKAKRDLESLGAEIVDVDFPAVTNYERSRPFGSSMVERGLVPGGFAESEIWDLSMFSMDDFLRANGDPQIPELAAVDGSLIFPQPDGALPDRYDDDFDIAEYAVRARAGLRPLDKIPHLDQGLVGLEATRRIDFEDWMAGLRLDAVVFPAVADIAPADADVNIDSADIAWRNGTWVANGNLVLRHLGIPTVTVPMGTMPDIGMPVGLTFASRAYDDSALLAYAAEFEQSGQRRTQPPLTPKLAERRSMRTATKALEGAPMHATLELDVDVVVDGDRRMLYIDGRSSDSLTDLRVYVDGLPVPVDPEGATFHSEVALVADEAEVRHSAWVEPYGSVVTALARTSSGAVLGQVRATGGGWSR